MEWHRYFGPFKTFLHQLFNNFNKTLIKSPYVFVIIVDTVIALQGRNSNPNPLYSKSKGINNIDGAHRYGSLEKTLTICDLTARIKRQKANLVQRTIYKKIFSLPLKPNMF